MKSTQGVPPLTKNLGCRGRGASDYTFPGVRRRENEGESRYARYYEAFFARRATSEVALPRGFHPIVA